MSILFSPKLFSYHLNFLLHNKPNLLCIFSFFLYHHLTVFIPFSSPFLFPPLCHCFLLGMFLNLLLYYLISNLIPLPPATDAAITTTTTNNNLSPSISSPPTPPWVARTFTVVHSRCERDIN